MQTIFKDSAEFIIFCNILLLIYSKLTIKTPLTKRKYSVLVNHIFLYLFNCFSQLSLVYILFVDIWSVLDHVFLVLILSIMASEVFGYIQTISNK